jgi:F-type H+-transporting ATPase subunit epsilon
MVNNKLIQFEIATPERVVLKEEIRQITVPTATGEITILPGHIPLVATLMPGIIHIKQKSGDDEVISVSGGFIEVLHVKVVILADTAERAVEIDFARAEEAFKRAEKIKKDNIEFDDRRFADVNAQIAKELARTKAVKRWKKLKNL